jgi:hypothetical protein
VVKSVGSRDAELHAPLFPESQALGCRQTEIHHSRAFQNPDTSIAETARIDWGDDKRGPILSDEVKEDAASPAGTPR